MFLVKKWTSDKSKKLKKSQRYCIIEESQEISKIKNDFIIIDDDYGQKIKINDVLKIK